jgi:hypothetical protein
MRFISRDDAGKALAAPLTKVEPEVVVQRASAIGSPRIGNECADVVHADGIHMSFDFKRGHVVRVPSGLWESRELQQDAPKKWQPDLLSFIQAPNVNSLIQTRTSCWRPPFCLRSAPMFE